MIVKNLQKRMDKKNLTDGVVAFHAGVSPQTIVNARKEKSVSKNTAFRIEKALEVL